MTEQQEISGARTGTATSTAVHTASARAFALAIALLSLVILGLILEGGGFTNRVQGTDLFGTFLPKFRESAELLRQGRVPLWNPFEYAGAPVLGFSHGGVLYPPVFLAFFALEPIQALQWLFAIHVIGYVALIVLCLTRSGLSLEAAAAAALLILTFL